MGRIAEAPEGQYGNSMQHVQGKALTCGAKISRPAGMIIPSELRADLQCSRPDRRSGRRGNGVLDCCSCSVEKPGPSTLQLSPSDRALSRAGHRRTRPGIAQLSAVLIFLALFCTSCSRVETDYSWQPRGTVTVIVPWAAGGATDQVTRVIAGELGQALGRRVVVANQPGASGAIGTRNALEAAPDGLTWTAGAASSVGTYPVLGLLDTSLADWHLFFAVANLPVVSVNRDTPYQDFGELLAAFEANPKKITVATAGIASSGHNLMELIKKASPLEYRHVIYDGGGPAVTATVAGETMVTTQLVTEQAEMIRAGRLRPLAVLSEEPFELDGHGTIPPITQWLPDVTVAPEYFGIWVRKGVPVEVVETVERIWVERISQSEALQNYARQRGALFTPYYGQEAERRAMPLVTANAWILHDIGQTVVSPDEVGIPRP